jgi:ribosomal protein S25
LYLAEVSTIGGAKKRNLAQMEKSQSQQDGEETSPKKTKGKSGPPEKRIRAVELQRADDQKLIGEISKMGAVTPYAVSSQFNLRIGAAKDLLEELEKRKVLTSVGGNARIRIYRAVAA